MGETGCGKTSLVRYLADISETQFEVLSIHAGIDETTIVHKVREVNQNAKLHLDNNYWIFLDEINTCDHLGVINSIICHRYFQGGTLAPNVTVLAACNPYRLRTHTITPTLE
jgi:midasin (ATPase involved in ribosome maturation)